MSVTSINLNYSNGQGGHTATITDIVGATDPSGEGLLGEVEGEEGETPVLSNARIQELLQQFSYQLRV